MAWWKATAVAIGAALSVACVVTTSDDADDDPDDLETGGARNSVGGAGGSGDAGAPATGGSGGTVSGGGAGMANAGAAGTEEPGVCEVAMDGPCRTCLEDPDLDFTQDDGTGVWDECDGNYPCCEESARYVLCMQTALADPDLIDESYDGDAEEFCSSTMLAGLDQDDASPEFYGLVADALGAEADPSCYVECFFPETD